MIEKNEFDNINLLPEESYDEEHKWHVVYVMQNRQSSVYRYLMENSRLSDASIKDVYFPKEVVKSWKKNKQVQEEKSVMNYLFVLCKVGTLESREFQMKVQIRYNVLGYVSQKQLDEMKDTFANQEECNLIDMKVGTKVTILKGSFAGLNGQIHSMKDNNTATVRIWLMHGCEPTDIDVQMNDITPQNDV